jgi:hypothetical protein
MLVSKELIKGLEEIVKKSVEICAEKYKFDAEEAYKLVGIEVSKASKASKVSKVSKPSETSVSNIPLPYNGELNEGKCSALRQNNGLYTQCTSNRRNVTSEFCKSCANMMQKSGNEIPEYGTIKMRQACGIFEYVDPKGRKPIPYTKIMKKYKITEEQVLEEAGKLNITINPQHFVVPEESKRGRPSKEKEPKIKGVKGRPKKSKKVIEVEGDHDDLFAALVAEANQSELEPIDEAKSEAEIESIDEAKSEAELESIDEAKSEAELEPIDEAKSEAELEPIDEAKSEAKTKKTKKTEKKAEKEAELAKKKAEKEAELAKKKAEKEAKSESKTKKTEKKEKPAAKPEEQMDALDEEADVVKKIEFEGKKYLKSKKSGIVYDYNEYITNEEQIIVGKWNDTSNKIDFIESEEEEEDYE